MVHLNHLTGLHYLCPSICDLKLQCKPAEDFCFKCLNCTDLWFGKLNNSLFLCNCCGNASTIHVCFYLRLCVQAGAGWSGWPAVPNWRSLMRWRENACPRTASAAELNIHQVSWPPAISAGSSGQFRVWFPSFSLSGINCNLWKHAAKNISPHTWDVGLLQFHLTHLFCFLSQEIYFSLFTVLFG